MEVYRKDSRKLPIGDPELDWEETVYLNLIIHQFDYTLTLAICTRTSPKQLQVLRRHSQVHILLGNYCISILRCEISPLVFIVFRIQLISTVVNIIKSLISIQ